MEYDVFLSHNSKDKTFVRGLANWLSDHGVRHYLDEQVLLPGDVLTEKLGAAMEASRSAIVCIGPHGEGPWHREEMDTLLNRAIKISRSKNEFRLIPVLLPNADTSKLKWFLETRLWCDLSNGIAGSGTELQRLKQAILGEKGSATATIDPKFNPYCGLRAFDRDDATFFFGRTAEIRELVQLVKDRRFGCIVGPSGNGKSSLARAGLYTETAENALPGISQWKRVVATPGTSLIRSILNQLY
ncbi:MAG: TIR domain-containing protein, partial [Roseimicrobium sp.]